METQEKRLVRNITVPEKDAISVAKRYFSILSAISNRPLTKGEINLLSYMAVKGSISNSNRKEEFCSLYGTTYQTISNLIYGLKNTGLLIKEKGKVKVNPQHTLQFDNGLTLQISLTNGQQ